MDTPGKRVYAIRLALGDGWKNPMTMAAFAALLTKRAGASYDSAKISRIESGDRGLSITEVDLIAGLDPQRRGREWLAWGEQPSAAPDYIGGRHLTSEEVTRARAARDAARASTSAPAKTPARKANGRKRG